MSNDQTKHAGTDVLGPETLPYEAGSSAELLSATHIFTVQLNAIDGSEWVLGGDELEHRQVRLNFGLLQLLKGTLSIKPDETFDLETEQHREGDLFVSDYHGFWSHTELESGAHYLVLARGTGDDPTTIMQEPAIQSLMDASAALDVKGAINAERRFGSKIHAEDDQARRCALGQQLLRVAYDERGARRGLFGRYVWARIKPIFPSAEDDFIQAVFEVVRADDTTIELREALVYGLYEEVLSLGPTPQRSLNFLRPLFALLLQPKAAPLFDRLLQVPIYNLLFRPGAVPAAAETIIPNANDRKQVRGVIAEFSSSRAQEVLAWLEAK